MNRISMPDGNWIDIREPGEVMQVHRRMLKALTYSLKDVLQQLAVSSGDNAVDMTEQQANDFLRMQEISIVAVLAGWGYPEPLPTLETVGLMTGDRFDAISEKVAAVGADIAKVSLNTVPTDDPADGSPSGGSEPLAGP